MIEYEKNKEVGKASKVNLVVSTGINHYKSDVIVDLQEGVTKISLWIDGQVYQESGEITDNPAQYTFKDVETTSKQITAVLKIKTAETADYIDYQHITIDLSTGAVTVTKSFVEPPVESTDTDVTDDFSDSSDTGSTEDDYSDSSYSDLTEEDYDDSLIEKARINFRPGVALVGILSNLSYQKVAVKTSKADKEEEENNEGFEE